MNNVLLIFMGVVCIIAGLVGGLIIAESLDYDVICPTKLSCPVCDVSCEQVDCYKEVKAEFYEVEALKEVLK